jgi:Protein kinase domain
VVSPGGQRPGGRVLARRYHLQRVLGRGAMGAVWEAEDTFLRRTVAVKEVVLPGSLSPEERAVSCERTLREARAIARLGHPNVVTLFDVLDEDSRPWVVMELVPSRSLAEVIKEDGPLHPLRVATVGLAILGALEAAHAAGITHRDVKPGNILLGHDGRVKLTDFGIARAAGDDTITGTGLLVGSPSYIAPEIVKGLETGAPADMWGLGATLYAAVEGRAPFSGGDAMETLAKVVQEPPTPYQRAGPLVPALDAMLEKDPVTRARPVDARRALLDVLRGGAETESPARPAPPVAVPDPATPGPGPTLAPPAGPGLADLLVPVWRQGRSEEALAGAPARETGPSASETGPSGRETEPPAGETDTPGRETGPAPETGPPARETGTPAREIGPSAWDTGRSAWETGPSARETGTPARETGRSAWETGPSAWETDTPARETEPSAWETDTHARETGRSARETGPSAWETGTPPREAGPAAAEEPVASGSRPAPDSPAAPVGGLATAAAGAMARRRHRDDAPERAEPSGPEEPAGPDAPPRSERRSGPDQAAAQGAPAAAASVAGSSIGEWGREPLADEADLVEPHVADSELADLDTPTSAHLGVPLEPLGRPERPPAGETPAGADPDATVTLPSRPASRPRGSAPPGPPRAPAYGSYGGSDDLGTQRIAPLPFGSPPSGSQEPARAFRPQPPSSPVEFRDERSRGGRRRRGVAALLVGAVLILAVLGGGFLLFRSLRGGGTAAGGPPSATASLGPATMPAGFTRYAGSGFTVGIPTNWPPKAQREGVVDARDPGSARFLRLITVDSTASALSQLTAAEQQFQNDPSYGSYQRLKLEKIDYRGLDAADWEFTFTLDGVPRHVLYRGIVSDGKTFGLYLSTPADRWTGSTSVFQVAATTFRTG